MIYHSASNSKQLAFKKVGGCQQCKAANMESNCWAITGKHPCCRCQHLSISCLDETSLGVRKSAKEAKHKAMICTLKPKNSIALDDKDDVFKEEDGNDEEDQLDDGLENTEFVTGQDDGEDSESEYEDLIKAPSSLGKRKSLRVIEDSDEEETIEAAPVAKKLRRSHVPVVQKPMVQTPVSASTSPSMVKILSPKTVTLVPTSFFIW
ncbi:hypothetical protein DXG01_006411 [Tephrocybe rancida]|nr:hypothetical protein DXG01_006411 [Tephrocybe rancida]